MGINATIDITPEERQTVVALLQRHLPGTAAWVYGSRARWTSTPTSDLDLVVFATPEQQPQVGDLREAFEDSDLPFRVDLFVWDDVPESFRQRIEADKAPLVGQEAGDGCVAASKSESDWSLVPVEQLAEKVAMGPFGSSIRVATFVPDGVPIISGQHLHGTRVDENPGFNFITQEHAQRLANANVRRGDVIFTHAGNIGQVAYIPETSRFERYVISQRQFYLRCDCSKVIPEYVARYFTSAEGQHQLLANTSQVGVPSIAKPVSYLRTLRIPVPPLPEQRAIAHILGTVDDKIELSQRMNATLEAMAQALFRSWFVDFDPVRAKMEGRGTGLPKEISDLFPDRLVDSELGEIPDGWNLKSLDSLARFQNGLALQKYRPVQNEPRLPVVKIAQLRAGEPNSGEWARATIKPECIIDDGDVVFSWSGSLLVRTWCGGPAALNQHLFKVTSETHPKWYCLHSILSHSREFQRIAADKATTMGHIRRHHLTDALCVVPPDFVIDGVSGLLEDLRQRQVGNEVASRTLATLRDTLLPQLVSGAMRVRDAERLVGAIA